MSESVIVKVFEHPDLFGAKRLAEEWCAANGISVGAWQRGLPCGLMYGDVAISKWTNLTKAERAVLDGTMTGDGRHGPITVNIKVREAMKDGEGND